MNLTTVAVLNAKPKERPNKLTDGDGMYLLVTRDQPNDTFLCVHAALIAVH